MLREGRRFLPLPASSALMPGWRNGRRNGLKIRFPIRGVRVRLPPRAPFHIGIDPDSDSDPDEALRHSASDSLTGYQKCPDWVDNCLPDVYFCYNIIGEYFTLCFGWTAMGAAIHS